MSFINETAVIRRVQVTKRVTVDVGDGGVVIVTTTSLVGGGHRVEAEVQYAADGLTKEATAKLAIDVVFKVL